MINDQRQIENFDFILRCMIHKFIYGVLFIQMEDSIPSGQKGNRKTKMLDSYLPCPIFVYVLAILFVVREKRYSFLMAWLNFKRYYVCLCMVDRKLS